ncbi:protein ANTHESIS POMOTING FACTOR 1-like [Populus alba x Populus x berolinensis]|uniref:Protein ANTHESIS POMOTING FACTOR 1-like n=1 Tax=Populus alba x Populus x berolinensis TaxID=444605 RepID=A0AAD6WL13_9ROSI|nr:protein ANTHESIS POMOTING FACTOR 1-like [Populus alba x Populus x berolinensis]
MAMTSLTELDDDTVRSMSIGAVFSEFGGKINSIDFHRKDDLLVTASEDDSVRLYDIASAKLLKTTFHKKHGADRICFTHHPSSVICSSTYNLDSTGESLRYLSMYDNRCLRYFKGHKESELNSIYLLVTCKNTSRFYLFFEGCFPLHGLQSMIASCLVLLITALEYGIFVEFCVYVVDPQLHMTNKVLSLLWQWKGVLLSCLIHVLMDKGPFDTFLVGGDTAEVCDIKFSNDGKSMLLTTTSNNIYVLDAYGGEKRCGFSLETISKYKNRGNFYPRWPICGIRLRRWKPCMPGTSTCEMRYSSCLKWAPRRAMFAAASTVLTFWIPDSSKSTVEPRPMDVEGAAPSENKLVLRRNMNNGKHHTIARIYFKSYC